MQARISAVGSKAKQHSKRAYDQKQTQQSAREQQQLPAVTADKGLDD
jgi:hypothetical protein